VLEVQRRIYRWDRLNRGIARRMLCLRDRVAALQSDGVGPLLSALDPDLDRQLTELREPRQELVIGEFDQDGRILSRFGPLAWVESTTSAQFAPRYRYRISLVDLDDRLGVRKEFGTHLGRFVQELEALIDLDQHNCPVPRVMRVDWEKLAITLEYLPGPVLRESLALAGATLRERDVQAADTPQPYTSRVRSALALLPQVISGQQIAQVAQGLKAIHAADYALQDVKYGNIILNSLSGDPQFIDFERALPLPARSPWLSNYLQDIDRQKFVEHFGPDSWIAALASDVG
jgi:tRNA A-37 threonylcarbamoyl transferase component Bud32